MSLEKFASIIGPVRLVAHELGFAVAVHGSLKRDIDLVAIPWTVEAVEPDRLVMAICDRIGCVVAPRCPRRRPHGRIAYILIFPDSCEGGTYIDLSVMQLVAEPQPPAPGTHLGNGVIQP